MFTQEQNQVVDDVLKARRTCRAYSDVLPTKEEIEAVIEAGRLAPYASVCANDMEIFRHFFVIPHDHPMLPTIDQIIRRKSAEDVATLQKKRESDPFFAEYGKGTEMLWTRAANNGLPAFPNPPCLIVMAEWRGAREAERQSLAHCLQNMWIKATAMNLAMKPVSVIEGMVEDEEFCALFDLPVGRYGFLGCVLGHAKVTGTSAKPISAKTHWL